MTRTPTYVLVDYFTKDGEGYAIFRHQDGHYMAVAVIEDSLPDAADATLAIQDYHQDIFMPEPDDMDDDEPDDEDDDVCPDCGGDYPTVAADVRRRCEDCQHLEPQADVDARNAR